MDENVRIKTNIAFFAAFLGACIIYRAWFFMDCIFIQADWSLRCIFAYLSMGFLDDLVIATVLFIFVFILQFFSKKILFFKNNRAQQLCDFFGKIFLYLLLVTFTLIYLAHKKLFATLFIGLNYNLLRSSLNQGFSIEDYYYYLNIRDVAFISAPLIIYTLLRKLKFNTILQLIAFIQLPLLFLFILIGVATINSIDNRTGYLSIFYPNPAKYILNTYLKGKTNKYAIRQDLPGKSQLNNIHFVDPAFINPSMAHAPVKKIDSQAKDWNIVLIVLESVGSKYVFDTSHGNVIPMPFLYLLAKKAVWFNNSYSSGNNSPLAQFGLFSGIYPNPTPHHFEMQPRLQIPSIANWLGKQYDSFFITPGSTGSFFVNAFINNKGFKEFYSADTIPTDNRKKIANYFLNEVVAMDFFLSRLDRAKPPFLAIYWSGAAHFPYQDYGPEYRILDNTNDPYSRYLNNLNLLDAELRRVYSLLREKELLDKTIFIVVGDHGEGFNQHPNSSLHGTSLYEEQIKIPMLIYQPTLFHPQVINQLTSNVDILPTLLDILNVQFSPHLFQGESLLRPTSRNYVFVYGNEDELAAINKNGIKIKLSFANANCSALNLNHDPLEENFTSCHSKQESTLIKFRNYQSAMLEWYNKRQ